MKAQERRRIEAKKRREEEAARKKAEEQKKKAVVSRSKEPRHEATVFEASAYIAMCDTGCSGVTATGYDVRRTIFSPSGLRIIAADPRILPLGTIVRISYGSTSFKAVVLDTGGAINGHKIDILVASTKEAFAFGRQNVAVERLN